MRKDHREYLISLIKGAHRRASRKNKYPRALNLFSKMCKFLSTQKFVTALAGPVYERSRDLIEIDITYACNLRCYNCNRCCGLAPSDDRLGIEQIQKFLQESRAKDILWKGIRILGGEPTLHPEFFQIVEELIAFKESQYAPLVITIVTNGFGKKVNDVIKKISSKVVVENSAKKLNKQEFVPFNLAPKDFGIYRYADYSTGCWIPQKCGIGLSPYGYYPCGIAAAIDRVLGFDIGRKSLPELGDDMRDQMKVLCGYCGFWADFKKILIDENIMSESWRIAYENYKVSKPRMTFY